MGERDRETERQRETERDRERDRERQRERDRDKEREREKDIERDRERVCVCVSFRVVTYSSIIHILRLMPLLWRSLSRLIRWTAIRLLHEVPRCVLGVGRITMFNYLNLSKFRDYILS